MTVVGKSGSRRSQRSRRLASVRLPRSDRNSHIPTRARPSLQHNPPPRPLEYATPLSAAARKCSRPAKIQAEPQARTTAAHPPQSEAESDPQRPPRPREQSRQRPWGRARRTAFTESAERPRRREESRLHIALWRKQLQCAARRRKPT
jgi:hypothetical protein